MKRVLVTGAAGTIGFQVIKQLTQNKDFEITAFELKSERNKKKFAVFHGQINIIYGNILNESDLKPACMNKDFVIHLAAIIPPFAEKYPELTQKVNVSGTWNLVRILERFSPQAFLLFSSSISVYGDRVKHPYIKVTDPLYPSEGDNYGRTKVTAENFIRQSNLNWSIFRLCAIMDGHRISGLMFREPLETSFEISTPADVARAFVNAIDKTSLLSGQIFNLGGGPACRTTYRNFLNRSLEIQGLSNLKFPAGAFAEKNFHCGFYADGDDLENILHFRKDTLETYFSSVKKRVSWLQKSMNYLLKPIIRLYLLQHSEPLQAIRQKNKKMISHFFYRPIS